MGTRANDIATVFKESNLIDSDRIATGAISSGKILNNAVTTNKILDDLSLPVTLFPELLVFIWIKRLTRNMMIATVNP